MTYLKPVLPVMAEASESFLNIDALKWADIASPLTSHEINKFKPLMIRVEQEKVDALIEETKENLKQEHDKKERKASTEKENSKIDPIAAEIEFDDFAKIDLRIAKIIKV